MANMSLRNGRRRRMVNEINVVPYIDVMLVLLVIFMVSAPLLSPGVIDLRIPSIGAMTLEMKGEDGSKTELTVAPETLEDSLRKLTGGDPRVPVVISADKAVIYENVMGVMNQLKQMGIQKVGLLVKKAN